MEQPTLELLKQSAGLAGIPLIILLTRQTRKTFPQWSTRAWPSVAIFWGVVLNLALAYALGLPLYTAGVVGVIAGVMAGNRWDAGKPSEGAPRG